MSLGCGTFWKRKEKKYKRNINNDLAMMASQSLERQFMTRIRVGEVIIEGVDILDRIRKSGAKDNEVVKVVEKMKRAGIKMLRNKEW